MSQALFDALRTKTGCATDKELAKVLHISPSHISACRSGKESIGAEYILKMYDYAGMSIEDIRALIKSDAPKAPSGRALAKIKKAQKDLMAQLTARPKRRQPRAKEEKPDTKRLIVTKAAKWTSTVHRVL